MSITSIDLRRTGGVAPGVAAKAVGLKGSLSRFGGGSDPGEPPRRKRKELTRNRLFVFGGIIFAGILLVAGISFFGSRTANHDLNDVDHEGHAVLTVEQTISDGEAIRAQFWMLSLANQVSEEAGRVELQQAAAAGMEEAFVSLEEHMAEVAEFYADDPAVAREVETLQGLAEEWISSSRFLLDTAGNMAQLSSEELEQVSEIYEGWSAGYTTFREQQELLSDMGEELMTETSDAAESSAQRREWIVLGAALTALVLLLAVGRQVVASVQRMRSLQAEMARTTSMMENSPTGMMFTDLSGIVQYANPAAVQTVRRIEAAFGVTADELVGSKVGMLSDDPVRRQQVLADPDATLPIQNERKQVGDDWLEFDLAAIKDDDGRIIGVMSAYRLITDEVRAEQDQQAAAERERAQAAELESKVDSLLTVVAAAADGDLTVEVPVSGNDAIGQMGEGVAKLLRDLRSSISAIATNSEALAAAAEELQVVSEQMGANAAETSSQVSLVTGGSVEVSRNVETVSAGAEQMTASIKEIAKNASEAAKVAGQAVDAATRTNGTVAKLGDSSTEIGQIVKVITGIAQQTNLLALNATIEAARAGEAGKGFAVVANEVKELAKETAKATEDISQKIETIQGDTGRSVEAIEEIAGIINQISEFQNTIASAVEEQAATTSDIARSVTDASRGSSEITANMQAVTTAAESTASGAADSQRASSELARMAADLQKLVGQFSY
jgi:PAS domain S-box-containing protein